MERAEPLPEPGDLPPNKPCSGRVAIHMGSYGRVESLAARDFPPSRPQFGDVQVLELFAVPVGGAGLGRLERLPARLEFVPGLGPHLSEIPDAEGQSHGLIENSAERFRARAGARLAPGQVAHGVLLPGDQAGGVAGAPAQNREAFAAQTTEVADRAGTEPVATLLVHALPAVLTVQHTLAVAGLAAVHDPSLGPLAFGRPVDRAAGPATRPG